MVLAAIIPSLLFLFMLFYCTVIGTGANYKWKIVTLQESIKVTGIVNKTTVETISKDEESLVERYQNTKERTAIADKNKPFDFLSAYTYKKDGNAELLIGNVNPSSSIISNEFKDIELPALTYVTFFIKEKNWLSWTTAIEKVRKHIYSKWMIQNGYEPDESFLGEIKFYEKENDTSVKRILLYVAIKKK